MTAQAGAVAAWQFRFANEGDDKLLLISHPEHGGCGVWKQSDNPRVLTGEMLYLLARDLMEAPAAVPVEALEGLVAELMTRVEADKAQCTNDDGSYRSDAHRAAWNFADGLEHAADKVYELIKERSNG